MGHGGCLSDIGVGILTQFNNNLLLNKVKDYPDSWVTNIEKDFTEVLYYNLNPPWKASQSLFVVVALHH